MSRRGASSTLTALRGAPGMDREPRGAGLLIDVETIVGPCVAIVIAAGLVLVSQAVAWRVCRNCDTLTRWVAVVAALAWVPTALFHLLASQRAFARMPASLAIVVLAAAAWRAAGPRGWYRRSVGRDRAFARAVARRCLRSPYRLVVLAFLVCAAPPILRAFVLPPLGWDTLTYHSVKAAMWVQSGGAQQMTGPGPWAYYRNMPGGAEVFLAWAMLPTSSDLFAALVDVALWLSVGLAAMVLARRLGAREPFASAAAGFVLAIPTVRLMIGSGYSELCLLSTFLSGVVLGVTADRHRPGLLALAGGALGVSAATKVPMIGLTLIMLCMLVVRFLRQAPKSRRPWAVASIVAYGVAVVPWFVTAAIDTGGPLSPVPLKIGRLVLGEAPPEVVWYLDRAVPTGLHVAQEISVLRGVFALPGPTTEAAGILSALPLVGLFVGIGPLIRRRRFAAALLLAAIGWCVAGYFSPPFAVIRHHWTENSSRFLLPAIVCWTVMSVSWCRSGSRAAHVLWLGLVACTLWNVGDFAFVGFSRASVQASAVVAVALCVLVTLVHGAMRFTAVSARTIMIGVLAILAVAALQRFRDTLRPALFKNDVALHSFSAWRYWAGAVSAVDHPGSPYKIAVTSGPAQNNDQWFAYPFMGRRLQNDVVYVPVSGDGHLRHFGKGDVNDELVRTASFWAWHLRLQRRMVTHVVSFSPPSIELGWMEQHPEDFERVAGAPGDWGLFSVGDASVR